MKNATLVFTFVFLISNCQSSRDKCYEFREETDFGSMCNIMIKGYVVTRSDEVKRNSENPILVTCLLAEQQNKDCKKKRNWDIVDIF